MRFIVISNYRIIKKDNIGCINLDKYDRLIKPIQKELLLNNNILWGSTCSHRGLLIEDNSRYHFIAFTQRKNLVEEPYSFSSILLNQYITNKNYFTTSTI